MQTYLYILVANLFLWVCLNNCCEIKLYEDLLSGKINIQVGDFGFDRSLRNQGQMVDR